MFSHKTFSLNNFDNIQPNQNKSSKDRFIGINTYQKLPSCLEIEETATNENTYFENILKANLYSSK